MASEQARGARAPKGLLPPGRARSGDWREQLRAALSGAADAGTFGGADYLSAGLKTLLNRQDVGDFASRYRAALQNERDQDRYDGQHYGTARTLGQIGATGAELAALGPVDAALAGGARIAQAASLLAREQAVLAGGGAALNTGMRAAADVASGHRSSLRDYAGSAVGGAVNGLAATRMGPGRAAAIGGAVESGLDDVLGGRPVSPVRAMQSAVSSAAPAALIGRQARLVSSALPIAAKGGLGEVLGAGRALVRGEIPSLKKIRESLPSGRYTVPDIRTRSGLIEAKFGPTARLSTNQKEAVGKLPGFQVFHFLPRDVGALFGFPAGLLGRRTDWPRYNTNEAMPPPR